MQGRGAKLCEAKKRPEPGIANRPAIVVMVPGPLQHPGLKLIQTDFKRDEICEITFGK